MDNLTADQPPKDPVEALYELTFHLKPEYLYAAVSGPKDSVAISLSYWTRIANERKARGYKRVLIDEDLGQKGTMVDMYEFVEAVSRLGFEGCKVAFVDRQISHNEYNEFGETVALNRGMIVKVCVDLEDAETWLLAD